MQEKLKLGNIKNISKITKLVPLLSRGEYLLPLEAMRTPLINNKNLTAIALKIPKL